MDDETIAEEAHRLWDDVGNPGSLGPTEEQVFTLCLSLVRRAREEQEQKVKELEARIRQLEPQVISPAHAIWDKYDSMKKLKEESEAKVKELEALLSGRTISCGSCNEMAKKLAEAQRENEELKEAMMVLLPDDNHRTTTAQYIKDFSVWADADFKAMRMMSQERQEAMSRADALAAELASVKKELKQARITIQGEMSDPNGSIWECYSVARKELDDLRAQNEKAEARVKALEIELVDLRTSIDRGDYNYTPQRIFDGLKYEKEARQSETNRANKAESLLAAERERGRVMREYMAHKPSCAAMNYGVNGVVGSWSPVCNCGYEKALSTGAGE